MVGVSQSKDEDGAGFCTAFDLRCHVRVQQLLSLDLSQRQKCSNQLTVWFAFWSIALCAVSDKTEASLFSVIRNGQWRQRGEGGRAPEDPAQTADADSSRTEGTATLNSYTYTAHVPCLLAYHMCRHLTLNNTVN